MADVMSILASSYKTAGLTVPSRTPYVAVDPTLYEGTWTGKWADNKAFTIKVSQIEGFRAKVSYSSNGTNKYQEVLIMAIAHYSRALEINPNSSNAQVNWGNALVRLGRPDEAIEHYTTALRLRPDNADAHHNWGVALARQGRYAEAVEQFQDALKLDSTHVEARDYLAKAAALAKQRPK